MNAVNEKAIVKWLRLIAVFLISIMGLLYLEYLKSQQNN